MLLKLHNFLFTVTQGIVEKSVRLSEQRTISYLDLENFLNIN